MRTFIRLSVLASLAIAPAGLALGQVQGSGEAITYTGAEPSPAFEARRVTLELRARIAEASWRAGDPIREIPKRVNTMPVQLDRQPARAPEGTRDPLVEVQRQAVAAEPVRAFGTPVQVADAAFPGANPPDTVGDIGADHYIHMTNSSGGAIFTIYDKVTGGVLAGPLELDTLGSGDCGQGLGDPIVLYDHAADRWLLSEFSAVANKLCVYISVTGDPVSGGWFAYEFAAANSFPDYPKYAVWPDAYYMSSNETNPTVYAFDRAAMLAGSPATFQSFNAASLGGFGFQSLQPSDVDGQDPPAGAPNYFLRHRDDEAHDPASNDPTQDFIEIFEFHPDFADPTSATFTGPFRIGITEINSELCGFFSFNCFPQPAGPQLDPLREVVMWRVQYRNFGSHEAIIGSMVTDVDGTDRGGVRWFELRKTGAGGWALFQEGTYATDDGHNRFMPSIAMDQGGNIALGYSIVSAGLPASVRYTGRLQSDPPGAMSQPEVTLAAGVGNSASNRWGDYSSMNVDPEDGCTFWYTNQFANNGLYNTRIGRFKFDQCGTVIVQPPIFEVCRARPWLCNLAQFEDNLVILECFIRGCVVLDPIPKNCLLKFACPGCPEGGLCPPFYHLTLKDFPQEWRVDLVDASGNSVSHERLDKDGAVILSFQPGEDSFIDGSVADYFLAFQLGKDGKLGERHKVAMGLEMSDRHAER